MHPPGTIEERSGHSRRIAETEAEAADLRKHLAEIVEGGAFRGSHRSGQFLTYIVEQAIAGHFESLKERAIGVELFGRLPSYDTGDDAIVRVTASDVRRRLLQHYGEYGSPSGLRLNLPLGSYVPLVAREVAPGRVPETPAVPGQAVAQADVASAPVERTQTRNRGDAAGPEEVRAKRWKPGPRIAIGLTAPILLLVGFLLGRNLATRDASLAGLPWSIFLNSPHPTEIIASDPAIAGVQELIDRSISASDYANHSYLPDAKSVSPETLRTSKLLLGGANPAAIDASIAVNVAALSQSLAQKLQVHSARSLRMEDLKTDDNFIFLGSPRSNPWTALFADQLDFRFVFNREEGQELIQDMHPRAPEHAEYRPTALGGGTGESFAVVALVQNLDQNGQVLLLAGANAEGTEVAAKFVTDLPRFKQALATCGVAHSGSPQHFEFLLRLNTMAGAANEYEVVACHLLTVPSPH